MIVREVAVVEEAVEGQKYGDFPMPLVLRLVRYVKMTWRKAVPPYSPKRLHKRDNYTCGYCGKEAKTIDHIVPRCQGGKDEWLNTVSSCRKCNSKKGNKSLKDSGLTLIRQPYVPTWNDLYA
jgi:5-methylcytosine-specific restriction endonuclease McrA